MGYAKEQLMRRQENIEWAIDKLVEGGAAYRCEVHGDAIDSLCGEGIVEEIATAITDDDLPKGVCRDDLPKLLQDALENTGMECSGSPKDD
jgi:hypothetical protein